MYTQCPECSAAFRVTANDLKQAAGKVRCGGCGRAFDALEFLTEDMPVSDTGRQAGPKLPELKPDVPGKSRPRTISPEDSIALLKTLDQLAGSDIKLEDTGIEWRVLDDQVLASLETGDESSTNDADAARAETTSDAEPRYDDDTPMDEEPREPSAADAEPQPEATPAAGGEQLHVDAEEPAADDQSAADDNEPDIDFDDDESGEWEEILDEFDGSDVAGEHHAADDEHDVDSPVETIEQDDAEDAAEPRDDEVHEDGPHDEAADDSLAAEDDAGSQQGDGDGDGEMPPDEASHEALAAEDDAESQQGEDHGDEAKPHDQAPEEALTEEDDADSREAEDDSDEAPGEEQSSEVVEEDAGFESIILEGDTVRRALDDENEEPYAELTTNWAPPDDSPPTQRSSGAGAGMSFVAVLLLAALGLQAVHQNRTELATIPAVRDVIAPLYRAIGMPLVPQWNVSGWRFEATQGNTEADQLIVYSRLGNTADEPLPYPLIGVSLTDRFEEPVGGVLLEPAEYLTDVHNPLDPVAPGDTFDALITLQSPDPAATGYRLRACYRASLGKLRCAVGDFKQ